MSQPSSSPPPAQVLLVLFDGFNTLDANGPLDVLTKSGTSKYFQMVVASETEITKSIEGAWMQRHRAIDQALIDGISAFDVLVVPGGPSDAESGLMKVANDPTRPFNKLIKAFAELQPSSRTERILLSVCTGAIFLAKLGIFNGGRFCTTHWAAYDQVAQYNKDAAGQGVQPGVVIPARYVDSGLNANGVRIISSGGISCGLDAAMHVTGLKAGDAEVVSVSRLLDYDYKKTVGVQFAPAKI
eukprot:TRINITY_DN2445_c0_g1_i4.p1 TRINITY_DN2445_c0_g1~~TRINITY_DN2445_c0_g1_i4.p1  ORF type:complete len:263 (+),score=77.44 TRINITY_DN2445_c0_g1_i4:66-791(+)